jgi:hypothetical protein
VRAFITIVLAIVAAVAIIGYAASKAQTVTVTTCNTLASQCYQTSYPVQQQP